MSKTKGDEPKLVDRSCKSMQTCKDAEVLSDFDEPLNFHNSLVPLDVKKPLEI